MGKNELVRTAICDAGPLIHLDELKALDLLDDFALLVPAEVWREIHQHRPLAADWVISHATVEDVSLPTDSTFTALVSALSLDAGEQFALALARIHPDAVFFTDDAAARLAAEQEGIRVHGTIGILLRAIRRAYRPPREVLALLQMIPSQSTLYIRPSLLGEIVEQVVQQFGIHP
jgi:predicted nucleic acid-binding protein